MSDSQVNFLDFSNQSLSPRNLWTKEQREILCVLRKYYRNSWPELTKVFNKLFEKHLNRCGLQKGIPASTFSTQWHDLRRWSNPIWVAIDQSNIELPYNAHGIIRKIAILPEVSVCLKPVSSLVIAEPSPEPELLEFVSRIQTQSSTTTDIGIEIESIDADVSSPLQQSRQSQPQTVPAKSRDKKSLKSKPQILYRFWNTESYGFNSSTHFIAGLWATGPTHIPHPRLYDQRIIENQMTCHLSRYPIHSPFISCFDTPLASMHRTLTAGHNAQFSIIDASRLDQAKIFSAEELLRRKQLPKTVSKSYIGISEWLVWGDISQECIIATVSESDMQGISASNEDIQRVLQAAIIKSYEFNRAPLKWSLAKKRIMINFENGMALGKFYRLINLPESYVNNIGRAFSRSWNFCRGNEAEFYAGLHAAYQSLSQAMISPPTTPQKPASQFPDPANTTDLVSQLMEAITECSDDGDMSDGTIIDEEENWDGSVADRFAMERGRVRRTLQ